MPRRIREYRPADHDSIVGLSLRAWTPVFSSVEGIIGHRLAHLLHGEDWRAHQAQEVSDTLRHPAHSTWILEEQGQLGGFVVAKIVDQERRIGEIPMLAVDPPSQRRGAGRALTDHATDWLRRIGMRVAVIGTGGDPGHAPARRLYECAGYRPFPVVQFYKEL